MCGVTYSGLGCWARQLLGEGGATGSLTNEHEAVNMYAWQTTALQPLF